VMAARMATATPPGDVSTRLPLRVGVPMTLILRSSSDSRVHIERDATGHFHTVQSSLDPARGGTRRRWALARFDVTCAQVETADDEARHALLEGV
jgi:hypothetical protein